MAGEIKIEKLNLEKQNPASAKIENPLTPENKTEVVLPKKEKDAEVIKTAKEMPISGFTPISSVSDWQKKQSEAIDNILADGLDELFLKMKPEEQKAFKKKGEETVKKISLLLNQAKIKMDKLVSLIRHWLLMIKGINKFFLEQEVKIKTDKILRLRDRK